MIQFVIYCKKQDILYRFSEYYLYFSIRISSFYMSKHQKNRSLPLANGETDETKKSNEKFWNLK